MIYLYFEIKMLSINIKDKKEMVFLLHEDHWNEFCEIDELHT